MYDFEISLPKPSSPVGLVTAKNCDKEGSLVAARMASAMRVGVSTRRLSLDSEDWTSSDYIEKYSKRLFSFYGKIQQSSLLQEDVLVLSSVHRAALYIAEVLHAKILPLQLLSFSRDLNEAISSNCFSIAGADYDLKCIWQWNKMTRIEEVPPVYVNALERASRLILVRSTDTDSDCPILGNKNQVFFNASLARLYPDLWNKIRGHLNVPSKAIRGLRQWEWGLPDETIQTMKRLWLLLGKTASDFHIVEASTIELYRMVPFIWKAYLDWNNIPVSGISLNAYWFAQPSYERLAGIIPFPFYTFDSIHGIADYFLPRVVAGSGARINSSCAFLNRVGDIHDPEKVIRFLRKHRLEEQFWVSIGLDGPDATCKDVFGLDAPPPYRVVMQRLKQLSIEQREYRPLSVERVLEFSKHSNHFGDGSIGFTMPTRR